MNENEFEKNNRQSGNISGFDNTDNGENTEYTVTPNGNYYSKKSEDIIQDEVSHNDNSGNTDTDYQTAPTYTASYNNYYNSKQHKAKKVKSQKSGHSTATVIVSSILAAIIGAASSIAIIATVLKPEQSTTVSTTQNTPTSNVSIKVDETASSVAEAVAEKCTDSVVGIRTTTSVSNWFGGSEEQSGEGSRRLYYNKLPCNKRCSPVIKGKDRCIHRRR